MRMAFSRTPATLSSSARATKVWSSSQTIERPQSVYAPQGRRALFKEPNKRRNGIIVMALHQKALGCPAPPNVRAGQLSYKFCGRRLAESNVFGQGQRRLCLRDDPVDSAAVLSVI